MYDLYNLPDPTGVSWEACLDAYRRERKITLLNMRSLTLRIREFEATNAARERNPVVPTIEEMMAYQDRTIYLTETHMIYQNHLLVLRDYLRLASAVHRRLSYFAAAHYYGMRGMPLIPERVERPPKNRMH